jgi:hypothetical protein
MAQPRGYKAVRKAIIAALKLGNYQHEARAGIDAKNLLSTGVVSAADVIDIIKRSDGSNHECSPLHGYMTVDCHVIKAGGWYVKFYFLDPATIFISVHQ